MGVSEGQINNIMGGMETTAGVRLHTHRHKLKQRFDIVRKLGQGTYGKVQLAINKETGQEVAIKTIKKAKIETEQDLVRIRREIQIMSSVTHPHIIHIFEVFENRDKMVLVMEYAAGGELYDYLSERKVLSENEARRVFRQVATACYYCHKHKICHRDLKLENILLDEYGNAKIADFGLSNVFDEGRQLATFCGSPLYASPEIVRGTPYVGPEVDCWSLGVLLYTLVYGAMPFDGSNFKKLVKQITTGEYFEPKKPSPASELISGLLSVAVERRYSIGDICSHWWVNKGSEVECLRVAEDLASQTPVRLDLLLSLAPQGKDKEHLLMPEDAPMPAIPPKAARSPSRGTSTSTGDSFATCRSRSLGSLMEVSEASQPESKAASPRTPAQDKVTSPKPTKRGRESDISVGAEGGSPQTKASSSDKPEKERRKKDGTLKKKKKRAEASDEKVTSPVGEAVKSPPPVESRVPLIDSAVQEPPPPAPMHLPRRNEAKPAAIPSKPDLDEKQADDSRSLPGKPPSKQPSPMPKDANSSSIPVSATSISSSPAPVSPVKSSPRTPTTPTSTLSPTATRAHSPSVRTTTSGKSSHATLSANKSAKSSPTTPRSPEPTRSSKQRRSKSPALIATSNSSEKSPSRLSPSHKDTTRLSPDVSKPNDTTNKLSPDVDTKLQAKTNQLTPEAGTKSPASRLSPDISKRRVSDSGRHSTDTLRPSPETAKSTSVTPRASPEARPVETSVPQSSVSVKTAPAPTTSDKVSSPAPASVPSPTVTTAPTRQPPPPEVVVRKPSDTDPPTAVQEEPAPTDGTLLETHAGGPDDQRRMSDESTASSAASSTSRRNSKIYKAAAMWDSMIAGPPEPTVKTLERPKKVLRDSIKLEPRPKIIEKKEEKKVPSIGLCTGIKVSDARRAFEAKPKEPAKVIPLRRGTQTKSVILQDAGGAIPLRDLTGRMYASKSSSTVEKPEVKVKKTKLKENGTDDKTKLSSKSKGTQSPRKEKSPSDTDAKPSKDSPTKARDGNTKNKSDSKKSSATASPEKDSTKKKKEGKDGSANIASQNVNQNIEHENTKAHVNNAINLLNEPGKSKQQSEEHGTNNKSSPSSPKDSGTKKVSSPTTKSKKLVSESQNDKSENTTQSGEQRKTSPKPKKSKLPIQEKSSGGTSPDKNEGADKQKVVQSGKMENPPSSQETNQPLSPTEQKSPKPKLSIPEKLSSASSELPSAVQTAPADWTPRSGQRGPRTPRQSESEDTLKKIFRNAEEKDAGVGTENSFLKDIVSRRKKSTGGEDQHSGLEQLKYATLPAKKKTEIRLTLGQKEKPEATAAAAAEFRAEVAAAVTSPTTQRTEVKFPVAAPQPVDRAHSLPPQRRDSREHLIRINMDGSVAASRPEPEPFTASRQSQPPSRTVSHTKSLQSVPERQRLPHDEEMRQAVLRSLPRARTQLSMPSGVTSPPPEPIKKSPREFIIPIALEGGGTVTPPVRAPSEEPETAPGPRLFRSHRMSGHRRMGMSRPRTGFSVERSDSFSSAGEDEEDDQFEILTAESLFTTLLDRVRNLTRRVSTEDSPLKRTLQLAGQPAGSGQLQLQQPASHQLQPGSIWGVHDQMRSLFDQPMTFPRTSLFSQPTFSRQSSAGSQRSEAGPGQAGSAVGADTNPGGGPGQPTWRRSKSRDEMPFATLPKNFRRRGQCFEPDDDPAGYSRSLPRRYTARAPSKDLPSINDDEPVAENSSRAPSKPQPFVRPHQHAMSPEPPGVTSPEPRSVFSPELRGVRSVMSPGRMMSPERGGVMSPEPRGVMSPGVMSPEPRGYMSPEPPQAAAPESSQLTRPRRFFAYRKSQTADSPLGAMTENRSNAERAGSARDFISRFLRQDPALARPAVSAASQQPQAAPDQTSEQSAVPAYRVYTRTSSREYPTPQDLTAASEPPKVAWRPRSLHDSVTYRPSGEANGRDGGRSGSDNQKPATPKRCRSLIEASPGVIGTRANAYGAEEDDGFERARSMVPEERRRPVTRTLSLRQPVSRQREDGFGGSLRRKTHLGSREDVPVLAGLPSGASLGDSLPSLNLPDIQDYDATPVASPEASRRRRESEYGSEYSSRLSTPLLSPDSNYDYRSNPLEEYLGDYRSGSLRPSSPLFGRHYSSPSARSSERSVQSALADIRQKRELRSPQPMTDLREESPAEKETGIPERAGLLGGAGVSHRETFDGQDSRESPKKCGVFDELSRKTARLLNLDKAKDEEDKRPPEKKADQEDGKDKEKKMSLSKKLSRIPSLIRRGGSKSEMKTDEEGETNLSHPTNSVENQVPTPINPDLLRGAFDNYPNSEKAPPASSQMTAQHVSQIFSENIGHDQDACEPQELQKDAHVLAQGGNIRSVVDKIQRTSDENLPPEQIVMRNIAGQIIQQGPATTVRQSSLGDAGSPTLQKKQDSEHSKINSKGGQSTNKDRKGHRTRSCSRERSEPKETTGEIHHVPKKKSPLVRLCLDTANASSEEDLTPANGDVKHSPLAGGSVTVTAEQIVGKQNGHGRWSDPILPNAGDDPRRHRLSVAERMVENGPELEAVARRRLGRPLSTDHDRHSEIMEASTADDDDEDSVSERILRKSFFPRFNERRRDRSASREVLSLIYDDESPLHATAESRRAHRRQKRNKDATRSESLRASSGDPAEPAADTTRYCSTLPRRIKLAGTGDQSEPDPAHDSREALSSSNVSLRSSHESLPSDSTAPSEARSSSRLARIEEGDRATRRRTGDAPYFRTATAHIPSTSDFYRRHTTALSGDASSGQAYPYRRTSTSRLSTIGDQLKRNFDSVTSDIESLKEARRSRHSAASAAADSAPIHRLSRDDH